MHYQKSIVAIAVFFGLLLSPLCSTAYSKGPGITLDVRTNLFQTTLARDLLEQNFASKAKVTDISIALTSKGLELSGVKEVTLFPDIKFRSLIGVSSPGNDQMELLIRKAQVSGVELKWLSALIIGYLESKIETGSLGQFVSITSEKWVSDGDHSKAYRIRLKLKTKNIVKAIKNPVITNVSVTDNCLTLSVDGEE